MTYYDCCECCEHTPHEVYPDQHTEPCEGGCNDEEGDE